MKLIPVILMTIIATGCAPKVKESANNQNTSQTVEWAKNASIYEVNLRQYTPEGTFNAFSEHLPRLKELGVDILWLMPVQPISEKNRKGALGSYYSVQDFQKINPEYGTMDDFKALVKKAHDMGFKVIIDWVANHTGWDNLLIEQHPDWYTQKDGQIVSPVEDWSDVADLNYDNQEMRKYMIESLGFWVKEADIDGYRCDMAGMVPTDFWEDARVSLDSIKPVFMLAEAWEPALTEKAFDASYGWDLHHLMNDLAQGKKDGMALTEYFAKIDTLYNDRMMIMNFIDNHDENSWQGYITERMGNAHKVYAVMSYTVPGLPLIYTGQEAGLDKRLEFFAKDNINWSKDTTLAIFYQQLNALKHANVALNAGAEAGTFRILPTNNEKAVFAFERKAGDNTVIVVLNLTGNEQETQLSDKIEGTYTDYFTGNSTEIPQTILLEGNNFNVFVK